MFSDGASDLGIYNALRPVRSPALFSEAHLAFLEQVPVLRVPREVEGQVIGAMQLTGSLISVRINASCRHEATRKRRSALLRGQHRQDYS